MTDRCCTTMHAMTLTQEDLRGDPRLSEGPDLSGWEPLVEWREDIGIFVIGGIAIFHCPWCGSLLPNNSQETLARARQSGVRMDFAAGGGVVEASIDGVPVDPETFLADLRDLTKDQD